MTTVTQYYGITQNVPFLDVNVHQDNRMYVDPFAVRMGIGPKRFATSANHATETFFNMVTRCAVSRSRADHATGLDLLQHFEEPRETRLGMAAAGFDGHGGAAGVGADIWDVLTTDAHALVRIGILKQIEDMPLFVPGVGNDITSDLTTRVIYRPLADFTKAMVGKYPALAGGTGLATVSRQTWDPSSLTWKDVDVELPTVDGQPLLLVPKGWARHELTLSATRFYDTSLLTHVQMQRATRTKDGRLLTTPKDRLRKEDGLKRSYATIVRQVEAAYRKDRSDVVEEFKEFAKSRYAPTTDDMIERRTT
ncbi:hypothetical protein [Phycicoccus flavus]|uniref:hypothetical protein n=1 Tax=Phycicoccus flavus TaxID=2502783 RepID=UPI000FEBA585|nr:hypothetical protein [Phycicoccus flavus]NHA69916.1 hypothetical protein [Phycicoccus flavus]